MFNGPHCVCIDSSSARDFEDYWWEVNGALCLILLVRVSHPSSFFECVCVSHIVFFSRVIAPNSVLKFAPNFSSNSQSHWMVVWVQRGQAVLWLSRAAQMAVFTSGTSAGKASSHSKWCCWLNILLSGDCHCQLHLGEFNKPGYLGEAKALRCTVCSA